jgi:hypothetical protein
MNKVSTGFGDQFGKRTSVFNTLEQGYPCIGAFRSITYLNYKQLVFYIITTDETLLITDKS